MKTITYTCDRCKNNHRAELKSGPISVEITTQAVCYKRISVIAYNEHLCDKCLETLEISLIALVDQFVRNE